MFTCLPINIHLGAGSEVGRRRPPLLQQGTSMEGEEGVPAHGRGLRQGPGEERGSKGRGLPRAAAPGAGTGATGRGGAVGAAGWPVATAPGGRRRPRHGPVRALRADVAAGLATAGLPAGRWVEPHGGAGPVPAPWHLYGAGVRRRPRGEGEGSGRDKGRRAGRASAAARLVSPGASSGAPAPAQRLALGWAEEPGRPEAALGGPIRAWFCYPRSAAHALPRRKWPPPSWPPPVSPVYCQVGLGLSTGRCMAVPSGLSTSAPATLGFDVTTLLQHLLGAHLHGNQSCPPCSEATVLGSFAGCLMASDLL